MKVNDMSLDDIRAYIGSHDTKINLFKQDPKVLEFFADENTIQKLVQIVFTERSSAFTDFTDLLLLKPEPLFKALVNSESFSHFFYQAIKVVSKYPETCTVSVLNKVRTLLPKILAFIRTSNYQNSKFYQYALDMFDILVHNFNNTNYVFLQEFIISQIPNFVLTEQDFERIIFKDQKVNPIAIPFITFLHNQASRLLFDSQIYIHNHFITFIVYALASETPVYDSMKVLDFVSEEIEKSRKDKLVKEIVYQFYDNAHPYVKSQIIKRFHILPTDYVQKVFDPETNNFIAKAILDLMISKDVLKEKVAKFVNEKTIQDFPETFPFIVTIFEKCPELRPSSFNEYLEEYRGKVFPPKEIKNSLAMPLFGRR